MYRKTVLTFLGTYNDRDNIDTKTPNQVLIHTMFFSIYNASKEEMTYSRGVSLRIGVATTNAPAVVEGVGVDGVTRPFTVLDLST